VDLKKTYIHPLSRKSAAVKSTSVFFLNSVIFSVVSGNLLDSLMPTLPLLFLKRVVLQN
jgi:hypothetical protein